MAGECIVERTDTRASLMDLLKLVRDKVDPALVTGAAAKVCEVLEHVGSSAPRARGADGKPLVRWQDAVIAQIIPQGASVLDLGCGDGHLLSRLAREKDVHVQGVDLDGEAVFQCVEAGVPVIQCDLDEGLKGFPDGRFDYVILEETLQTLQRPDLMLGEMLRVGRQGLVSFPNFGYWRVRVDLMARGRMPVTEWLPYRWYDTPNIHLFCLSDFTDWAEQNGVAITEGWVLSEGAVRPLGTDDNLYAEEALLLLKHA